MIQKKPQQTLRRPFQNNCVIENAFFNPEDFDPSVNKSFTAPKECFIGDLYRKSEVFHGIIFSVMSGSRMYTKKRKKTFRSNKEPYSRGSRRSPWVAKSALSILNKPFKVLVRPSNNFILPRVLLQFPLHLTNFLLSVRINLLHIS